MSAGQASILLLYFFTLFLLSLYGFHRAYLLYLCSRHRGRRESTPSPVGGYPTVVVQLPIYNEKYVVERLIEAVCRFDYPRDKLTIQLLDDSTDETTKIIEGIVCQKRKQGLVIDHIRRPERVGFKAGALQEGLGRCQAEFVVIFDADFLPPPDMLKQTLPYFADKRLGMVQMRWGYLNRHYSLFTRLQSILLNGHFVVEQTARCRAGRFFNFNGTAGVWRRECLIDAGGWQSDTLTEDLDISYRAQLEGWRFFYLTDTSCPGELPAQVAAFKMQQFRWAKGSIQTGKKLLYRVLSADLPTSTKLETIVHLTANGCYVLLVLLALLIFPAIIVRERAGLLSLLWIDMPLFCLSTMSLSAYYLQSQRMCGKGWWRELKHIPLVFSLGIGLSLNNAWAVLQALLGRTTPFHRTPKFRIERSADRWNQNSYSLPLSWSTFLELALGLYFTLGMVYCIRAGIYAPLLFLCLFQFGYLYLSLLAIYQAVQRAWRRPSRAQEAASLA